MKKVTVLLLLCLIMCSCEQKTCSSLLRQSTHNIIEIKIIQSDNENNMIEHTLSDNKTEDFLDSLLEMPCYIHFPPSTDYGHIFVQLYYENGDVDIIGIDAIGYKTSESEYINGKYYVSLDDMYELYNVYFN